MNCGYRVSVLIPVRSADAAGAGQTDGLHVQQTGDSLAIVFRNSPGARKPRVTWGSWYPDIPDGYKPLRHTSPLVVASHCHELLHRDTLSWPFRFPILSKSSKRDANPPRAFRPESRMPFGPGSWRIGYATEMAADKPTGGLVGGLRKRT